MEIYNLNKMFAVFGVTFRVTERVFLPA